MKITTRIISGYALFIVLLVGLVVYQLFTINRMQSINRIVSSINFQYAKACLQASRDLDLVEEYAKKLFASVDPDYLKKLRESQKNYETSLMQIKTYAKSAEEIRDNKRLSQLWDNFKADLELWEQDLPKSGTDLPKSLQDDLEQLSDQTVSVYQASLRSMSSTVETSRKTGEMAALVLLCVTFVVLAISILVSSLIYRSISKPLANLTEGTRAIAEGKFFYRLDTSRKDEFSQLAKDFNTMTQRLNELDELKKGFVTHVSHELKAPLASMKETIQLLLDEIPGPLTEKQKRLLSLNFQSGMRLTAMISNLLDISRTEAGVIEYELKSQDLVPLVRSAVAELEVPAQERQVQFEVSLPEAPLPVECDKDRIVQVLLNLMGNAVNFSPKKATVRVSVEAASELPGNVPEKWRQLIVNPAPGANFGLVTVADSGPGVPDSDKEKIFERFHQVKQGKKLSGQGAGLGLAISRIIVQAHRGAIWVEDNPGGGSRFRMLLRPGGSKEGRISRASKPI